jgi:hypothetical protein
MEHTMSVLVLPADVGEGHRAAAHAIAEGERAVDLSSEAPQRR